MPVDRPTQPDRTPPTLGLMHAVFILAGFGTMLLGPILPLISRKWYLDDSMAGQLLLAQFLGATLGGITVSSRLTRDLLVGLIAAAVGFGIFAFAVGWSIPIYAFSQAHFLSLPALFVGGFGVGRVIATVNILAGARYTANRAAALTRLNFTWSFGALLSPLLAAWLVPHFALHHLLAGFASCFALCAVALLVQFNGYTAPQRNASQTEPAEQSITPAVFIYFAALIFLYGGLETCLSGWLTTYALRYGKTSFVLSEYTLVLLLAGLTAGRALAAWLLLRIRDTTLQRIALVLSAALAAALAAAHQASLIATLAVLLGIALAPIFPATFAIFLGNRPPARVAGIVLAASGLGAAALPSLIGVISTRTGSLQLALTVPVATAIAMLALTALGPKLTAHS